MSQRNRVYIHGIVHALDNIEWPHAYARALFYNSDEIKYEARGKSLYWSVKAPSWCTTDDTIASITSDLIKGNYLNNVEFDITLSPQS